MLAPRVRAFAAFSASALAWVVGGLTLWTYYRQLKFPLWLVFLALFMPAIVFGLITLVFRSFLRSGQPVLAVVSLPCLWVAYEYLTEYSQGTYSNVAYTQMDCLPLLQLASVTGLWGIGFMVFLFGSTVATVSFTRRWRLWLAAAPAVVFVLVLGFGYWRLNRLPGNGSVVVGLVASDLKQNLLPEAPADAARLLREYASEVEALARRGARISLLPEMSAVVTDSLMPEIDAVFGSVAQATGTQVLVPIIHPTPSGRYNEARLYSAAGTLAAAYHKHYLVPVYEDRTSPGTGLAVLRQQNTVLGIEICKDMDYPELSRRYGQQSVGLLLVPAWDFGRDAWLHGRMAIMRGVENGFNIARVAKNGRLTLTDTRGRVLAEQHSSAAPFSTLVGSLSTVREPTLYTRWGDWFAWIACGAAVALVVAWVRPRLSARLRVAQTMKVAAAVMCLLLVLPRSAHSQERMSAERLGRIHETIERQIASQLISGAVTLVARRGQVVHFEAHGLMDLEAKKPMQKDAIFVLASMTKPVTGVAVMMLIEEGKVRLTDPVSKFIPQFKDMKIAIQDGKDVRRLPADREITIRDLLTHTSGLGSGGVGTRQGPEVPWPSAAEVTLARHMPLWAAVPLDFQPGTRWGYSPHAGIDILGRVVEVASGLPFQEFVARRILVPLEMKDTFFVLPKDRTERLASIYQVSGAGLKRASYSVIPFGKDYYSGAIGLVSTAEDYFHFAQMLLDGGRWKDKRLLSPRAVALYSSNHVGDLLEGQLGRPRGMGFGLTVEVVVDFAKAGTLLSNGTFGWDGSYGTRFFVDPKEQLVGILMIQTSTSVIGAIERDFETAVMQAVTPLPR
jgi:apolipoprotein N-acyltransferase